MLTDLNLLLWGCNEVSSEVSNVFCVRVKPYLVFLDSVSGDCTSLVRLGGWFGTLLS